MSTLSRLALYLVLDRFIYCVITQHVVYLKFFLAICCVISHGVTMANTMKDKLVIAWLIFVTLMLGLQLYENQRVVRELSDLKKNLSQVHFEQ